MTTFFPFPPSFDIRDAIFDVALPGEKSTLAELEAFERLQKSDPLNIAFSIFPKFSFILAEFGPSFGRLMEQPEYRCNIEFQLKAMKLCFYGVSYKFNSAHPDPMFHVTELVEEVESVDPEFFLECLVRFVRDGDYLLTRSWYCLSPLRQLKTIVLAMTGFGKHLHARTGNFDHEINRCLRTAYRQIKEGGYYPRVFLDAMYHIHEKTDDVFVD
jgi:hypothetical protein